MKKLSDLFNRYFIKHVDNGSNIEQPFYLLYPSILDQTIQDRIVNISHNLNFVYFRIFKAANSTVVASLYYAETGVLINSLNEIQVIKDNHYSKLGSLNSDEVKMIMNSYFKFTFVRNPYVRVLAAYLDKVVNNQAGKRESIASFLGMSKRSFISFDEFLVYLEQGGIKLNAHWAKQIDLLPIPISSFDFIGKTENFSMEFPLVLNRIFQKDCEIISIKEHATKASEQIHFLDKNTLNRIYKLYKSDFEIFGYPKLI